MDIQNQIIAFAEKHSLREKALSSVDMVMDASIEADKEIGVDFLEGHDRTELIYKFGKFAFQINKDGECRIVTKINIYSKRLYGENFDVPVGYYEEWTDLEGGYLDEFLTFDWSPVSPSIDYHIERISNVIPQRYYKRNVPQYEFVTYVNHTIVLFKGRQFHGAILFIKRCLDYLGGSDNKEIDKGYLGECLQMFQDIYHFVRNNDLVEEEKLSDYRINERIKKRKANNS